MATVFALVGAIVVLVFGSIHLRPTISAGLGHGTSGYFVAQSESCGGRGGCTWHGQFELPDGTVTRSSIAYNGSDPGMTVGTTVPALDTGDPTGVFQPGSISWFWDVLVLLIAILVVVMSALRLRSLWSGGRNAGLATDGPGQSGSWSGPGPY